VKSLLAQEFAVVGAVTNAAGGGLYRVLLRAID
jgi:hypothetical protein